MTNSTGPDPLSAEERRAVLREHLEREKDRRRAAEARLSEIRQAITTFQAVRVCGPDANDLAEAVRQILDRKEAGNG